MPYSAERLRTKLVEYTEVGAPYGEVRESVTPIAPQGVRPGTQSGSFPEVTPNRIIGKAKIGTMKT